MANTNITIRIDEKLKSDLQELLEKLAGLVATAVVDAMKKYAEEATSSAKEDEEKLEKADEESSKEEDDEKNATKKEDEENKEDEEKLEKSIQGNNGPRHTLEKSTSKIPQPTVRETKTFLNSETRDRFGRNKKYL